MEAKRTFVSLALLASVALACDDETGPAPEELIGTWTVTKMEFVNVAQPTQTVDFIAEGGAATVVLAAAGSFTMTVTPQGEPDEIVTGTWESEGDVLTLTQTAPFTAEFQFDIRLSGDTLTLTGADAVYDFDDDGEEEPAKLNLELER